jgi:ERCC4-related helicase
MIVHHTRHPKAFKTSAVYRDFDNGSAAVSNDDLSTTTSNPLDVDKEEIASWIYPTNYPVRKYQLDICRSCLFSNTLVCLPTGLGKTLIASVVMFNFYRWFPEGKVVFMAPTKPLVTQQIEACHSVVGIPESITAHLDGDVPKDKRKQLWKSHQIFYCTPQTFQNDLQKQNCDPTKIVCIVIDEAHKATKKFAYTEVIKEMSEYTNSFRVLALTATPGKEKRDIQAVIDNLKITKIEIRSEDDSEISEHTFAKQVEIIKCKLGRENAQKNLRMQIVDAYRPLLLKMHDAGLVMSNDAESLNTMILDEAYRSIALKIQRQPGAYSNDERADIFTQ